jgi:hypothetical protein
MANDIVNYSIADDGFDHASRDYDGNVIKGDILKCSQGHWLVGTESTPLEAGARRVVVGTFARWIRWGYGDDGRMQPVDHRDRVDGRLPELEELPEHDATVAGPDGKPRPAWSLNRYLYLVDRDTAATSTYITSAWKGREAVVSLANQIAQKRVAHPGTCPIIEFGSVPGKGKYGTYMRPVLRVVGWVGGNVALDPAARGMAKLKQITGGKSISDIYGPETDDMSDSIPF